MQGERGGEWEGSAGARLLVGRLSMAGLSFQELIRDRAIIGRGLSVEGVAKLLGVQQTVLSMVLNRRAVPGPKMAGRAVALFGCEHGPKGCEPCADYYSCLGGTPKRRLVVSVEGLSEDYREWLDALVRGAVGREWFLDHKRKAGEA